MLNTADNKTMAREYVGMRLNPEIVKAIDELAKEQNRNRSNTIEWVLFEWFREHRPEFCQPVIKEAARFAISDNLSEEEISEAFNILAHIPGEYVADVLGEAIKEVDPTWQPKQENSKK